MPRTTDPDPEPARPLGERVPKPAKPEPGDRTAPAGPSGIVIGPDGRYRTTTYKPPCN
jgi:hypothetical protein